MSYSLSQAATATGKDRSTIQRAIKTGKISANLNESGAYQIDPAELHRVFPVVAMPDAPPVALQQNAMTAHREIDSENRELKARVELLREMVDDLKIRLDKSEEARELASSENRRLTLLLTDQRPPAHPQAESAPPRQAVHPFLWFGFAAVSIFAAWYYWPLWRS
jgi:hypothetical protein